MDGTTPKGKTETFAPSSLDFQAAALDHTVRRAQSMFQRVLVTWAGDVLELRRRDLLVPRWESSPTSAPCQDDWTDEPMKRVA